jgi:hypothetical protein
MKPSATPSCQIKAVRKVQPARARDSMDAKFLALLRRKCMRAASIGALTAAAESLPGLGGVLSLVFGELLDVEMLARVQRELVEDTFRLYGLELPTALHNTLVHKVQLVGAGASVASDVIARGLLRRALGQIGGVVALRVAPVASIVSSAFANATVTYAIGKRAQAVAHLRDAPITGMPDAVRAFTGLDERRVFAWSLASAKSVLGAVRSAVSGAVRNRDKQSSRKGAKRKQRKRSK